MSDQQKTEQPTEKRLRDSREKGDVPKSTEVVSFSVVAVVILLLISNSQDIFTTFIQNLSVIFEQAPKLEYHEGLNLTGALVFATGLKILVPIVFATICAASISLLIQIGLLFAPKAAAPKLENLSPKKWFQKVFSKKNLFEFFKNIIKVVTLAVAIYLATKDNLSMLMKLGHGNVGSVLSMLGVLFYDLFIYTIVAFAILAAIDFVYTRFKYTKDHMMSMDEVKREYKEMDGDPHIKQKRKQLHQEMINQNTMSQTKKAKAVVVNPTHFAVAIDYEAGRTELPVILAKGKDNIALSMIKVAKENKIPVMREPPLARALYAKGEIDEFVPPDLLMPVAKILKVVMQLEEESR